MAVHHVELNPDPRQQENTEPHCPNSQQKSSCIAKFVSIKRFTKESLLLRIADIMTSSTPAIGNRRGPMYGEAAAVAAAATSSASKYHFFHRNATSF